jgi:cytochrome c5
MKRYLASLSLLIILLAGGIGAAALQQDPPSAQNNKKAASGENNSNTQSDPGEQVFEQNCSRCHKPPISIPQRVTGTIIMHMRVRARLSRQDEQLLLKYMAP